MKRVLAWIILSILATGVAAFLITALVKAPEVMLIVLLLGGGVAALLYAIVWAIDNAFGKRD